MKRRTCKLVLFVAILSVSMHWTHQIIFAQTSGGDWTEFSDISNTPTASTYPCIAADMAGNIHVLWSEDIDGKSQNLLHNPDGSPVLDSRGNQINALTDTGNTLYYTRWNGQKWLKPIDVQFNSSGVIQYPQAVVDRNGILHVVWVATEGQQAHLSYSQVAVDRAEKAFEWSEPTVLAESVLFAYYPEDIASDSSGGLHVIYSQTGAESGTYVVNSSDGGKTWSSPVELYRTFIANSSEGGVSNTRLVTDGKDRLYATWSRYGSDGNGKGVYFSQSVDLGRTWSRPLEVAVWQPGWYEVDWLSTGVAGNDIHLVWEGSSSVAALFERVSHDGGLTWDEPRQILPKLVGENGFADLVTDSAGILHMLVVKRGDAGSLTNGIWYTRWQDDHWQDPVLLSVSDTGLYAHMDQLSASALQDELRGSLTGNGLRYQRAAIVNGNQLFVTVVNEWDGDIWSSHVMLTAPSIKPQTYPRLQVEPTQVPVSTLEVNVGPTSTPHFSINKALSQQGDNPGDPLLAGSVPVILLIVGVVFYLFIVKRMH